MRAGDQCKPCAGIPKPTKYAAGKFIVVKFHNPASPDRMSAAERIVEIGELLARCLIRQRARQSSPKSVHPRESSLDFTPNQSGAANIPFGDR